MNALELKNVTKRYDGFVLDHINLSVPRGAIVGLVGENGAGKSTTIKLLLDLVRPDEGSIEVLGRSNQDRFGDTRQDIGIVFDENSFQAYFTVRQINWLMRDLYVNWNEETFFEYIRKFDLPEKKKIKDFSRGMKMKLAIAAALSHEAKLLILDEPTGGLDPIVRDEVVDILYEFTKDEEHSVLISSHIVSDLEKLCDYIAFLHKGKLLFCKEKDELLDTFGVFQGTEAELKELPANAVHGIRRNAYAVSALVERGKVSAGIALERPSVEDVILFTVKEVKECAR